MLHLVLEELLHTTLDLEHLVLDLVLEVPLKVQDLALVEDLLIVLDQAQGLEVHLIILELALVGHLTILGLDHLVFHLGLMAHLAAPTLGLEVLHRLQDLASLEHPLTVQVLDLVDPQTMPSTSSLE